MHVWIILQVIFHEFFNLFICFNTISVSPIVKVQKLEAYQLIEIILYRNIKTFLQT